MGSRILILCICNGLAPSFDWPERGEGESREGVVEGEGTCSMVIGYIWRRVNSFGDIQLNSMAGGGEASEANEDKLDKSKLSRPVLLYPSI